MCQGRMGTWMTSLSLAHASVPGIPACPSGWGAASLLDCSSSAGVRVGCGQHWVPGAQHKSPQAG